MHFKRAWLVLTNWEQWHYNVKYVLLAPVWIWYSIRARSFYFFAPANPTLTFGGFEGGPKKEIYTLLPKDTYPPSIYIGPQISIEEVERMRIEAGLTYPIAVKPNVGMMGLLFRKIDNLQELAIYHSAMTVTYILQELIHYPIEVSAFYYRMPGEERGTITGFVRKEALEVTGDGVSTLDTLMHQLSGRPGFYLEEWRTKHQQHLGNIIPAGEVYKLSWVANLSRGSRLVSLEKEKDEQLLNIFDTISHRAQHLYYGRYDIKCASVEELKQGKNFSILEFNGTGAEPHHVYGNRHSFFQAYTILAQHWRVLFTIACYHHQRGVRYPTLREGIHFTRCANRHFKLLRQLDKRVPIFH